MCKLSVLLYKFVLFVIDGDINEALVSPLAQLSIHKCEYLYVKYYFTNNWKIIKGAITKYAL